MKDKDLERANLLFPNLKKETTRNLEIILLEIRNRDWATIEYTSILKHEYIQMLLINKQGKEIKGGKKKC